MADQRPTASRLGRGLSSLITEPQRPKDGIRNVAITDLRPGRYQPRTSFSEEEIESLAESLRHKGMLQPILARPAMAGTDGDLEIVAGERRWRAAQRAKLHEVPVVVRELSDIEVLEIALVENLQRENLGALEEASAYRRLIDEFGKTQAQVSEAVGKSRSHVANTLRLLELPDQVRDMLAEGKLSAGHARALLSAREPAALASQVLEEGLSVRATEVLAGANAARPKKTGRNGSGSGGGGAPQKDADTRDLERRLTERLGLTVTVHGKGDSGELRIGYRSLDDLDWLIEMIEAPRKPRLCEV